MSKHDSDWHIPRDWIFILGLSFVPVAIGIAVGILWPLVARIETSTVPGLYRWGVGAGVVGIALPAFARLPLYRRRRFLTFGPAGLDPNHRRVYWVAYVLVSISISLLGFVSLKS